MEALYSRSANGTGHPDKGPILMAIAITCLLMAWIGVSLRFYVRARVVKKIGYDDWLFLATLVTFSMYCGFVLAGVHYGTGQHIKFLSPQDAASAMKFWYCCECAFAVTTTMMKVAFGAFYLRLFHLKWQRYVLYAVMAVCVLFGIVYFFCIVFQCRPVSYMWTRYNGGKGRCLLIDFIVWGSYSHSIMSAAVDWFLALVPVFLVWHVQLDHRTKIAVIGVLGLGIIASISTLVRLGFLWKLYDADDFLWATLEIAIWATIECGLGLFCGGLAVCRPLLRSLVFRFKEDIRPRLTKSGEAGYLASKQFKSPQKTADGAATLQSQLSGYKGTASAQVWSKGGSKHDSDEVWINKTVDWTVENDAGSLHDGDSTGDRDVASTTSAQDSENTRYYKSQGIPLNDMTRPRPGDI